MSRLWYSSSNYSIYWDRSNTYLMSYNTFVERNWNSRIAIWTRDTRYRFQESNPYQYPKFTSVDHRWDIYATCWYAGQYRAYRPGSKVRRYCMGRDAGNFLWWLFSTTSHIQALRFSQVFRIWSYELESVWSSFLLSRYTAQTARWQISTDTRCTQGLKTYSRYDRRSRT